MTSKLLFTLHECGEQYDQFVLTDEKGKLLLKHLEEAFQFLLSMVPPNMIYTHQISELNYRLTLKPVKLNSVTFRLWKSKFDREKKHCYQIQIYEDGSTAVSFNAVLLQPFIDETCWFRVLHKKPMTTLETKTIDAQQTVTLTQHLQVFLLEVMPMVFKTICCGVSDDQRAHLDTFNYAVFAYDALRRSLPPGVVAVKLVQEFAVTREMFLALQSPSEKSIASRNNDDNNNNLDDNCESPLKKAKKINSVVDAALSVVTLTPFSSTSQTKKGKRGPFSAFHVSFYKNKRCKNRSLNRYRNSS